MFWRVVTALCALTLLIGGVDVLSSGCDAVDFGGTARSSTYACVPSGQGDASAGVAGLGMLGVGLGLFGWSTWPMLALLRRAGRPRSPSAIPPRVLAASVSPPTPMAEPAPLQAGHGEVTHQPALGGPAAENCGSIRFNAETHPQRDAIERSLEQFVNRVQPDEGFGPWFLTESRHALVISYQGSVFLCSPSEVQTIDYLTTPVEIGLDAAGRIAELVIEGARLTSPQPEASALVIQRRLNAKLASDSGPASAVATAPVGGRDRESAQRSAHVDEALVSPTSVGGIGRKASSDTPAPSRPLSVTAALEELEQLRRLALVTEDEYRSKREDILRRL